MLDKLEARVKELESALEQSVGNHNALLGRLAEAKHFLSMAADIAPIVMPEAVPVIQEAEHIVDAMSQ